MNWLYKKEVFKSILIVNYFVTKSSKLQAHRGGPSSGCHQGQAIYCRRKAAFLFQTDALQANQFWEHLQSLFL